MNVLSRENEFSALADRTAKILKCQNSDTFNLAKRTAFILAKKSNQPPKEHQQARDSAQAIYEQAAEAAAAKVKDTKKKKSRDDAVAEILLLLFVAGEDAYQKTYATLGNERIKFSEIEEQARTFAESRQDNLQEFAAKLHDELKERKELSKQEKLDEAESFRALRDRAKKIAKLMTDTEAQITYGYVQIDRLARAGFRTKSWNTMEDEKVRKSHVDCGEQGAIALDKSFINGLRFPGDPNGGAAEVCNCRCWLTGGSR